MKLPRLSAREKVMAGMVAGVLFLLFNLLVVGAGLRKQAELRAALKTKNGEWKTMQGLLSQRDLWAGREKWLQEKQPKLQNEARAGADLLDYVKEGAQKQGLVLQNPQIGLPEKTAHYRAVSVNVETKCDWAGLVKFLYALQQPEQFIVIQSSEIKIDPGDNTKMFARLRIAKWYSPGA